MLPLPSMRFGFGQTKGFRVVPDVAKVFALSSSAGRVSPPEAAPGERVATTPRLEFLKTAGP